MDICLFRFLTCKKHKYKIFWPDNSDDADDVGTLLAKKTVNKATGVVKVCDKVLRLRQVFQSETVTIIFVNNLQLGLPDKQKD